jgi:hypothetical protein
MKQAECPAGLVGDLQFLVGGNDIHGCAAAGAGDLLSVALVEAGVDGDAEAFQAVAGQRRLDLVEG